MSVDSRFDALFEGRPVGETVRVIARGINPLGGKPFAMSVTFDLPNNAVANEPGIRAQMDATFHVMFGVDAKHLDAEGEQTTNIEDAIEVRITGEHDPEAAAETRERLEELAAELVAEQEKVLMQRLLDKSIRGEGDNGPTLN
jgi:hypothetical protein